jgi:hypothetical protein
MQFVQDDAKKATFIGVPATTGAVLPLARGASMRSFVPMSINSVTT